MISVLIDPPEPGFEPVGPARQIDARARFLGHRAEGVVKRLEGRLDIGGECFAALRHAQYVAEQAQGFGRVLEAAIDQDIGNAGLCLHPVGEIDIGVAHRAEINDQIGLGRQDAFEIGLARRARSGGRFRAGRDRARR